MFKDGSQAWDAKDFLIEQERMEVVTIENKEYYGKHSSKVNEILLWFTTVYVHLFFNP